VDRFASLHSRPGLQAARHDYRSFHYVQRSSGRRRGPAGNALATRENAKIPVVGWELPWGRKNYFDRNRFDTDLKRIAAFYADRGYPDARVTGVEPKLNAKQDSNRCHRHD
jgi:hypothetical protein